MTFTGGASVPALMETKVDGEVEKKKIPNNGRIPCSWRTGGQGRRGGRSEADFQRRHWDGGVWGRMFLAEGTTEAKL